MTGSRRMTSGCLRSLHCQVTQGAQCSPAPSSSTALRITMGTAALLLDALLTRSAPLQLANLPSSRLSSQRDLTLAGRRSEVL